MLTQMAKESGIDTPTADDLVRIDRARKGKRLSNEEWTSKTDPEAGIARLKDGRTHLAYKHTSDITAEYRERGAYSASYRRGSLARVPCRDRPERNDQRAAQEGPRSSSATAIFA
jgi:hypothetical protein